MSSRKSTGKRLRFEILKRDGFRCVYCGASPLRGYLHVDHVVPVIEGGTNEPSNLVTACRDCNLGKGPVPLDEPGLDGEDDPKSRDPEAIRERAEQIREYIGAQRELDAARDYQIDQAQEVWSSLFPYDHRTTWEAKNRAFIQRVMERFDWEDVTWAMRRAAEQCTGSFAAWKYFCAISHRWLKDGVTR